MISIENEQMTNEVRSSVELYRKLYLIRASEERIIEHYFDDQMKTPMHMSMGEEAIVVGVCDAIGDSGQVFGTYRSHGLFLAKTGDVKDFFAEMYGKNTALLKGKGGSMHLCASEYGFMGTSAIVGSVIPVAVGAAFANKQKDNGKITAVFFGDGAIDEGVFWESINSASLMKLPILFVCEDNGYAVHTPKSARHGYENICDVVGNFNCSVISCDSTDVERISEITKEAIKKVQTEQKPCFLHLKYYRYLEHVGVCEDFDADYRSREEYEEWKQNDPIKLQRNRLKESGIEETEIKAIEAKIREIIDASIGEAQEAEFAGVYALYEEVI